MKAIHFIGAGPGDPELITVKGKRLVTEADIIIYAGSLVPAAVIAEHKPGCEVYNSASMDLPEIIKVMADGVMAGKAVARVHTGDPSIYGSIREQMEELDKLGITYEVIPGVSSFVAAAAAVKKEFTVPEISQTIILTRTEGRTPVPELEKLNLLASHRASMVIFLSVQLMDDVVRLLCEHYPAETPVAVVEKASWPEQRIVRGTLADIAAKVKEAKINKTAQILVGEFLGETYNNSLLYDPHFTHEYRNGKPCGE
ncbi:MAG: precorrin-4 C(11)-methyltransferase [Bacteroidota bacterium]|nr:precorrin-4 C(11)-methyltransferase [Bacteroidota bacterium]